MERSQGKVYKSTQQFAGSERCRYFRREIESRWKDTVIDTGALNHLPDTSTFQKQRIEQNFAPRRMGSFRR